MKSLRIYTRLDQFSRDLNDPALKLLTFAVSNGIVYGIFDVDKIDPVEHETPLVSSEKPTVSEQLENELEPLPGHNYKWDGHDIGRVLKHSGE